MADVTLAKVDQNEGGGLMNIMSRGVKVQADQFFDEQLFQKNWFDALVLPGGLGGANAFKDSSFLV